MPCTKIIVKFRVLQVDLNYPRNFGEKSSIILFIKGINLKSKLSKLEFDSHVLSKRTLVTSNVTRNFDVVIICESYVIIRKKNLYNRVDIPKSKLSKRTINNSEYSRVIKASVNMHLNEGFIKT